MKHRTDWQFWLIFLWLTVLTGIASIQSHMNRMQDGITASQHDINQQLEKSIEVTQKAVLTITRGQRVTEPSKILTPNTAPLFGKDCPTLDRRQDGECTFATQQDDPVVPNAGGTSNGIVVNPGGFQLTPNPKFRPCTSPVKPPCEFKVIH